MAHSKLQASSDFFKQLSLEFQQLNRILETLETFVDRAQTRSYQLSDKQLLQILDQIESFLFRVKQLYYRLESLLLGLVIES